MSTKLGEHDLKVTWGTCESKELTRSIAMIGGLTGTVCIASMETSETRAAWYDRHVVAAQLHQFQFLQLQLEAGLTEPLFAALRSVWAPRQWLLLLLAGLFVAGNWQLGGGFEAQGNLLLSKAEDRACEDCTEASSGKAQRMDHIYPQFIHTIYAYTCKDLV